MIELNKIFTYKGQPIKCVKIRKSGINTFQVVDQTGNALIKRDEKNPGVITDCGIRVITCYPCAKCGKLFTGDQIFSYVDGNNGAITKSSKGYCSECYKQVYNI
jgi:deoxycytidylate deaminase